MPSIRKTPPTIAIGMILRKQDAMKFVGLKSNAFDLAVKRGELPKPIKLTDSGSAVGWVTAELEEAMRRQIAKRDGEVAA